MSFDGSPLRVSCRLSRGRRRGCIAVDEVVGTEAEKVVLLLPVAALQDAFHGLFEVVRRHAAGDAAQQLQRPPDAVKHGFLALVRVGNYDGHATPAQTDAQDLRRELHAIEDEHRLAPVELDTLARVMGQGEEDRLLALHLPDLGDVTPHGGLTALVAYSHQFFVDRLAGPPVLPGQGLVLRQPPLDLHLELGGQNQLPGWLPPLVAGHLGLAYLATVWWGIPSTLATCRCDFPST